METILYKTTEEEIRSAAKVLANGGLVAFPTETVYGLGADAFNKDAAKKAYAAKGRPSDNPLIVHIAKFSDLYRLAPKELLDDEASENSLGTVVRKLANAFWPGPLTMILPKLPDVPKETTGGLDTVAIRMPKDEWTLKFIEYSGTLVSGPSANTSGYPSPTTWEHVKHDLDSKIDGIICGAASWGGIESTVISLLDLKEGVIKILRPGLVTPEMISDVTGLEVAYDEALLKKPTLDAKGNAGDDKDFHPMAPGMKYKHYAPKAEMVLLQKSKDDSKETFMCKVEAYIEKEMMAGKKIVLVEPSAKSFYADIRKADEEGADLIVATVFDGAEFDGAENGSGVSGDSENVSLHFSVMNRVLKAAAYNIIEL